MRRVLAAFVLLVVTAVTLVVVALLGLNLFLNLYLPALISFQPERLKMGWGWVWTWDVHHVVVEDFELRVQGPLDQWWLTVDDGELDVELSPFLDRRFQAEDISAHGVVLHYRGRTDAPVVPGLPPPSPFVDGRTAPIPGLEDPPLERPEDLYPPPAAPLLVALDRIEVDGLRELWLGDYRFSGDATASARDLIVLPAASLDLDDVEAEVLQGEVDLDGVPVVSDLGATLTGSLVGVDPVVDAGMGIFRHLDAKLALRGHVDDLRYIDIFLADAPWIGITGGTGRLDARLHLDHGAIGDGSRVRAHLDDLGARVGSYGIVGDGHIDVDVHHGARLAAVFDRFAVHREGLTTPLVHGEGFRLDATTGGIRIDEPPTGFVATVTLPHSTVPDLRVFDSYLPGTIGLQITGGSAGVRGKARVEADGDTVSGELDVDVADARLRYGSIPISGQAHVHGRIRDGNLAENRYDIRGSHLAVDHVSVAGRPPDWWARLDVRDGRVTATADTFLVTRSDFACSDTSPFLRVALGDHKVAPWLEELVKLHDLKGEARASFGQTSLRVDHLQIASPKALVHLHLRQEGPHLHALFFARLGVFGAATKVDDDTFLFQLIDADRWFHARLAEAGTPEDRTTLAGQVTAAADTSTDKRKGIKIIGSEVKNLLDKLKKPLFPKKTKPKP